MLGKERTEDDFAHFCHPEQRPLPLGRAPKSCYSGSYKLQDSGSCCFNTPRREMPKRAWRDKPVGYTLIELLVVVLIISILVAIALPQYNKVKERVRSVEGLTLLRAAVAAQKAYYFANDAWATTFDELDIKIPMQTSASWRYIYQSAGLQNNWWGISIWKNVFRVFRMTGKYSRAGFCQVVGAEGAQDSPIYCVYLAGIGGTADYCTDIIHGTEVTGIGDPCGVGSKYYTLPNH